MILLNSSYIPKVLYLKTNLIFLYIYDGSQIFYEFENLLCILSYLNIAIFLHLNVRIR